MNRLGTQARRWREAVAMLVTPVILTLLQALFWRDGSWSFVGMVWILFGSMAVYLTWLGTSRLGASRFEEVVSRDPLRALMVAFVLGALISSFTL